MRNYLFKRVISLVIALMMILSGTQVLFAVSLPTDEIELNKTATPVEGEENTYNIQLSVKGKDIDTGKKVDVILVIDNSASMFNSKYEGITLGKITEEAAKAFVDGVLTPANNLSGNVRVAVVKYGEQAKARIFGDPNDSWSGNWSNGLDLTKDVVYTTDITKANNAIESATEPTTNEGTNTHGGFLMAKKVAEVKRGDAESIVIFMTDGMPTYRYTGTGSNTTMDSSGSDTSRNELNQAIEAAQALKLFIGENGEIYTVALLNNVTDTSNQAKLAANLLGLNPKKNIRSSNRTSIMNDVTDDTRWESTTKYAEAYYTIHAENNAADMMKNIYRTLAGTISALANGYVTDVIDKNFELTEDSSKTLEDKGVEITVNDGITTLVFRNISASGEINYLHAFEVKVKPGVYGTGFTNEEAFYTFTLFGEEEESEPKYFEKPIVPINPTAVADSYLILQDEILTLTLANSILKNDETLKLEDGEYLVSELVVDDEYVTDITTTEGGTAVLQADGTFVYTPPSGFTGADTFVYKNKATVSGEGPLAKDYKSNNATVSITVLPIGTDEIAYSIKHLVQESNEELKVINGVGYPGQIITGNAEEFFGYVLAPEQPDEQQLTLEVEGYNTIVFWYVNIDEYYIVVKHHTRSSSSGSYSLKSTEQKILEEVEVGSTITGEDFRKASLISSNYKFDYSNPESQVLTESKLGYEFNLYYTYTGGGGGGGGGGTPSTVIPDQEIPLAELEKVDHFAYIIGYPEGDIRPMNNITREEVAMIFYRLLTDESRDSLLTDANPFTDVESGRWSNRAISTLYNADIISGYPDGTFRPSAPITRAEFATIAAKFDDLDLGSASKFTDIVGHWAEDYITSSENKGWIKGYPDLTFKPQQDITRAEAMTLINNVLERAVPAENIHPDAIFWPDISEDDWYYEAVMEATNSHDYTIEEDGDELWTGMKANKVWL